MIPFISKIEVTGFGFNRVILKKKKKSQKVTHINFPIFPLNPWVGYTVANQ